jgi:hypothetical protein
MTPEERSLRAAHAHAARFAKMTPEERSAEARRAINIRWAQVRALKGAAASILVRQKHGKETNDDKLRDQL